MPAITVDDLTVLPRLREPGLGDQPRPVWQVTTAPTGYEGEGFPVRRAFAGIDLQHLDPFIMMDQMGEVEYAPGEAKGTPVAPAPRLRDRHLHHRRRLRPPGQPRRWRQHHQRRHPVDDRRLRAAAHRGAAGVAGAAGRPVPRHPALGEPPARRQDEQPEVPGHPLRRGPAAHLARRRLAGPGHRGLGRRPRRPGLHVHADVAGARHDRARRPPRPAVERRLQRAGLRPQRQRHGRHRRPPDPHGPVRRPRRR